MKQTDPITGRQTTADASSGGTDLMPIANSAGDEWVRDETADGAIAPMPASNGQPASDGASLSDDTQPDSQPLIRLPIPNVSQCEHCQREFAPRRPWGRFCSAYCRRLSWLDCNPEKAAILAERDLQRLRELIIGCDRD